MSVAEKKAIDMGELLLKAYELSDLIKNSAEAAQYLQYKRELANDPLAQSAIREFNKLKERFEECERFGRRHPDFYDTMKKTRHALAEVNAIESVKRYREAEKNLDELLNLVSRTIAHAVSETVKVPSNNPLPSESGCGSCGSSGHCG
ncbi:MAG TPA: YlbF family regulator [Bacilli bacterium]